MLIAASIVNQSGSELKKPRAGFGKRSTCSGMGKIMSLEDRARKHDDRSLISKTPTWREIGKTWNAVKALSGMKCADGPIVSAG